MDRRWLLWGLMLASCNEGAAVAPEPARLDLSVVDSTRDAFSLPIPNLDDAHRSAFFVGNSLFNQNWLTAPASVDDRDGLGPLFNARSCSGCHFKDGRGRPPEPGERPRGFLLRVSVGQNEDGAPRPDPTYGDQLQTEGLLGVPAEVELSIAYDESPGLYVDGDRFSLRTPRYALGEPAYGPLPEALQVSPRVAPAVFGLGLLEAVPEATLRKLADPDDRDHDGISGRLNVIAGRVGRFGWKAEQPTVRGQAAAAFQGDMGITSSQLPHENHSAAQTACAERPSGGSPELTDEALTHVEIYMRTLAAPRARATNAEGAAAFRALGCGSCHVEQLRTGSVPDLPELAHHDFAPFTDLLLHDLGEGLSDERPSFAASSREWRTPPLWGIGLLPRVNGHQLLLHDGRARGVAEAILWHGGEAQAARDGFARLPRATRHALIEFVESL